MSRLLLATPILLTVDRVEPPVAVLEWPCGTLVDAPLDLLPPELAEGDVLRLRRLRMRLTFRFQPPGRRPPPSNGEQQKCHEKQVLPVMMPSSARSLLWSDSLVPVP